MFITYGYATKIVWLKLCVFIVVSELYLVSGMQCSNQYKNLKVLRFCTDDKVKKESTVVLDGHLANTLNGGHNCTCTARAVFNKASRLVFEDIPVASSFQNNVSCGSKVVFKQQNHEERSKICGGDGTLPINDKTSDITVTITLVKVAYPTNTNYSFCILFDEGNIMEITCTKPDESVIITTNDQYETEHSSVMYTEVSTTRLLEDTELTTQLLEAMSDVNNTTQQNITEIDNSKASISETIQENERDNSKTMYIVIGCGTGGFLIAVLVGIFLLQKLRKKKGHSSAYDNRGDDNDDYGVQYNSLYVSADDPTLSRTHGNEEGDQIDENYSEVDLIELQRKNENTELTKNMCRSDTNIEGNYSEIDLYENEQPGENTQEYIDYESSEIDNQVFKVKSSCKDKTNASSVRHVLASGDFGSEYAVVEKQSGDSTRNDNYAVVDKNRKINSK